MRAVPDSVVRRWGGNAMIGTFYYTGTSDHFEGISLPQAQWLFSM